MGPLNIFRKWQHQLHSNNLQIFIMINEIIFRFQWDLIYILLSKCGCIFSKQKHLAFILIVYFSKHYNTHIIAFPIVGQNQSFQSKPSLSSHKLKELLYFITIRHPLVTHNIVLTSFRLQSRELLPLPISIISHHISVCCHLLPCCYTLLFSQWM